jgi:mannose-1-phosphate guanylyltransferase
MIQESIDRIKDLIPAQDIFIITSYMLLEPLRNALPDLPPENIVAEPAKRNTAPCLALASSFIAARYDDDGITPDQISVAVLTADQRIYPTDGFINTVRTSMEYVEQNDTICTIGITPSRPETGYGYIEYEGEALQPNQIRNVKRFREKPNLQTAQEFLEAGNFLWNSGMFFWRLDYFNAQLEKHLPEVGSKISDMQSRLNHHTTRFHDALLGNLESLFAAFPSISIDFGLMEKADSVSVAKADFSWDDIGSWDSLHRTHDSDESNNICIGNVSLIDTKDSIILNESGDNKIISIMGLDNIVVVDTGDALMICPKDRVQDVKKQVEKIRDEYGEEWL